MKLRSIYHTSKGERGIGKWIVVWTWVLAVFYSKGKALKYNYSHESLWIPDEEGNFTAAELINLLGAGTYKRGTEYLGQCFSSTTRGGAKGVRYAPASEVLKHPERWEYIEFEVDDWIWDTIVKPKMDKKVGNKYDFVAVTTGFITPILIDPEDKEYCSGVCCWVKWLLYILAKWWKVISPRRSAMILAEDWGEPKSI